MTGSRCRVVTAIVAMLAATASAQEVGPPHGALVVVGGNLSDQTILRRFLDLAGGAAAPIVVIPTAGDDDVYGPTWEGLKIFREAGASNLTILHTRSRVEADTVAFADPLRRAQGVWFTGGRQWRLADVYLNTRVHRELRGLLDRGGVVGGSSAGATIQGSYLVRGDTKNNAIVMGDHEEGMAFLKNVAIDQHLLRRNRQFDLLDVIEKHPSLLGIGIDEDTAIVVQGDEFEVMGRGYVAIYDAQREVEGGGPFYLLASGDQYNLKTRDPFRPTTERRPLERIVKKGQGKPQ